MKKFLKKIATVVVVITTAVIAFYVLLPILMVVASPFLYFLELQFGRDPVGASIVFGTILLLLLILPFIRFGVDRRRFLKRLRRVCKERGFLLEIRRGKHLQLVVRTESSTYSCVVLRAIRRGPSLLLADEGNAYARVYGLRTPTHMGTRAYRLMQGERKPIEHDYLLAHAPVRYFTFPEAGKKAVIVNPRPRRVLCGTVQKFLIVDNGDAVDDYRVYTGGAFCNVLDRESTISRRVAARFGED